MRRRRPATIPLATVAAVIALAACSTEETATPRPSPPPGTAAPTASPTSTTSTASTTAPPDPTTTAATTSTAPTPTTATPPPVEPPTDPTTSTVPVFVGADGAWLLLGSWNGSSWDAPTTADGTPRDVAIPPGTAASAVALDATFGSSSFGPAGEACADGRTGPTLSETVTPTTPPGFGFGAVAVPGDADLAPRPIAVTERAPAGYADVVAGALAGSGLDTAAATIVQLIVSDLDADGDDEVIAVAELVADPTTSTPGDFSTVLVVDAATRATTVLATAFVPVPDAEDGAPPTVAALDRRRVIAVADLNADRRSEIVVQLWAGQDDGDEPTTGGAVAELHTFDGASSDLALSARC